MNIGENLKNIRESRNMTQSELAKLVGVNQSMICQIERGTKALNLLLAKPIADILECDINDFIGISERVEH